VDRRRSLDGRRQEEQDVMAANRFHALRRHRTDLAMAARRVEHGVLTRVQRALCGLHGHDTLLQFGHQRLYLKCVSCGHESPGWTISDTRAARPRGAARLHALVRPELAAARRIA
jgi:hypothetical protein